jgi:uncharacterized protein DUF1877
MSMIGNYRRVTPDELKMLIRQPSLIADFLYPPDGSGPPPDRYLDIDKAWDAINFLLTGSSEPGAPPLGNVVLGGTCLGDVDVGYGPARYLTAIEVGEVARALRSVSEADLQGRLDLEKMREAGVYPGVWEDREEELEYLHYHYPPLVEFFIAAAQLGDAMILYIN